MQSASVGLQGASAVMSVVQGFQQGAAADAQGKAQQKQLLNQGYVQSNVDALNAADANIEGRRQLGTMRAAAAGTGSEGGSALDVISQSAGDVGKDVSNNVFQGQAAMYSAQNEGAFARLRGKMARSSAIMGGIQQGIGSLAGAGASAEKYWGG